METLSNINEKEEGYPYQRVIITKILYATYLVQDSKWAPWMHSGSGEECGLSGL